MDFPIPFIIPPIVSDLLTPLSDCSSLQLAKHPIKHKMGQKKTTNIEKNIRPLIIGKIMNPSIYKNHKRVSIPTNIYSYLMPPEKTTLKTTPNTMMEKKLKIKTIKRGQATRASVFPLPWMWHGMNLKQGQAFAYIFSGSF